MDKGILKKAAIFVAIILIAIFSANVYYIVKKGSSLSFFDFILFAAIFILIKQGRKKKNTSGLTYEQILALNDPKIQEAVNLLSTQDKNNRLLGIKFLYEITKQNVAKYSKYTHTIFCEYLMMFSKENAKEEMQEILNLLFNRESILNKNKTFNDVKTISDCDFSNLSLKDLSFWMIDFENCKFTKSTDFNNCGMEDVNLKKCVLTDIRMQEILDAEFHECHVENINMTGDLGYIYFEESKISNIDFSSNIGASSINFYKCTVDTITINSNRADLYITESNVKNSNFSNSNYSDFILEKTEIADTFIQASEIDSCEIIESVLVNISFSKTNFSSGEISLTQFTNVDFTEAEFKGIEFYNSDLSNIDFSKTKIDEHTKEQIENCKIESV